MVEKNEAEQAPESVRSMVQRAIALIGSNEGAAASELLEDVLLDPDFPRQPEIDTWPAWAESIRKKLAFYGVYDGSEDEIDLAQDFDEWVDGFEGTCRHEVQIAMDLVKAAAEALAPFAAVATRMDEGFAAFLRKDQPEATSQISDAELAELAHPGTSNILTSGEMTNPALATMGDLRLTRHVLGKLLNAISLSETRTNLLESAPDDSVLFAMIGNPNILAATLGPDIEALKAIAVFHRRLAAKHLESVSWTSQPGKEWHGEQQAAHARYADLVDKLTAAAGAKGTGVKPLDWRLQEESAAAPHWVAKTPFGVFEVYQQPHFGYAFKGTSSVPGIGGSGGNDPTTMKASYEQQWAAGVFAALEPQPAEGPAEEAIVKRVIAWVREDVLPAYGITHQTRASDPEMIEGARAAVSSQGKES